MKDNPGKAILWAILAATLYAVSTPFAKLLLQYISPVLLAALLYLGAGLGLLILNEIQKVFFNEKSLKNQYSKFEKKDFSYVLGMIFLDIVAPIFMMVGLMTTSAANGSLLNNFEIVSTALVALFIFGEKISKRLWAAIGLVTSASILLSLESLTAFTLNMGSLFVLAACVCWGFENNCTRKLSAKNPVQIVMIKGIFSGLGSFVVALITDRLQWKPLAVLFALVLGFITYGLSIFFYIKAQRHLGAAKTSTYYAVAPFAGVIISFLVFRTIPGMNFWVALVIMVIGTILATEKSKILAGINYSYKKE